MQANGLQCITKGGRTRRHTLPQAAARWRNTPLVNHLWWPPNFTPKFATVQGTTFIPRTKSESKRIGWNFNSKILHHPVTGWDETSGNRFVWMRASNPSWLPRSIWPKLALARWESFYSFRFVLALIFPPTPRFDLRNWYRVEECWMVKKIRQVLGRDVVRSARKLPAKVAVSKLLEERKWGAGGERSDRNGNFHFGSFLNMDFSINRNPTFLNHNFFIQIPF